MDNLQQFALLSPLIVVSATATLVLLAIAFFRHHTGIALLGMLGLNIALFATLVASASGPGLVTDLLVVDQYACYLIALMVISTLAACTFAHTYQRTRSGQREEFYLLMLLSLAGGIVLACSRHFGALFIGLEMLSIPLYGLVGYNLNQARSLEGAIKYLVLSASGSALMLFGIALLYAQYGTLSLTGIGEQLANLNGQFPPMTMIAAVLVLIAMAFKLSLVPFHVWTPDVYEGAPAPIGAYLATTAKIAVAAVLLRLVGYLPVFSHEALRTALMLLAALSIIGGNLLAMLQTNIKRLLGYSSIAHFGYLMMAVVALNPTLTPSSYLVYLTAYLLATLAIFGVVTVVTAQQPDSDAADADQLFRYRGLYWRHPTLAIVMTIALLSLAGIPATVGFIGKFYVMLAAVSASEWALLGALVIGSAIGLYYYLRVMVSLYLEAPTAQEAASSCWSRTATIAVLVMLALLITLLGIMPSDLFAITASAELM